MKIFSSSLSDIKSQLQMYFCGGRLGAYKGDKIETYKTTLPAM